MTRESSSAHSQSLAQQRLGELLELLAGQGLQQQQVAARAGLPPQYVSDIKRGQRPMTELVARRLAEAFDLDYRWLLGRGSVMEPRSSESAAPAAGLWLPILPHPVSGEPRLSPHWDGTGVEIAGAAAAKAAVARQPYVLRFGQQDARGRLQRGDLVLVSQAVEPAASISVVEYRRMLLLARPQEDGSWERLAGKARLSASCPVRGHCLGIIWSSLLGGD